MIRRTLPAAVSPRVAVVDVPTALAAAVPVRSFLLSRRIGAPPRLARPVPVDGLSAVPVPRVPLSAVPRSPFLLVAAWLRFLLVLLALRSPLVRLRLLSVRPLPSQPPLVRCSPLVTAAALIVVLSRVLT